jgi:FtsH-binding integral membrane protein
MDLNSRESDRAVKERVPPEQVRYARVLDWTMKSSLGLILAGFVIYMLELLPARLPASEMPRYWSLPLRDFVEQTSAVTGWKWIHALHAGEYLALGSMAVLTAIPIICLMAVAPRYAQSRDWAYLGITLALVGVLMVAASGVLTP